MLPERDVKNSIALQLSPKCIHCCPFLFVWFGFFCWVFMSYVRIVPETGVERSQMNAHSELLLPCLVFHYSDSCIVNTL